MFGKRAIKTDVEFSMQFEDIQSHLRYGSVLNLQPRLWSRSRYAG